MVTDNNTLISNISHPDNGNLITEISDKLRGDGFYRAADGLHTIQWSVFDFVGNITIQATLATNPDEGDWFDIPVKSGIDIVQSTDKKIVYNTTTVFEYTEKTTNSHITNFIGNYVWIRCKITDWSSGTIKSIKLTR